MEIASERNAFLLSDCNEWYCYSLFFTPFHALTLLHDPELPMDGDTSLPIDFGFGPDLLWPMECEWK